MTIEAPSPEIVEAFGIAYCRPIGLKERQGAVYRVGNAVIKRCDDPEQTEWLCGVMEGVEARGFRVARPIRTKAGRFVADGWCAQELVAGTTAIEGRWDEALGALWAFHEAVGNVAFSPLLQRWENPWTQADAAVWSEDGLDVPLGEAGERLLRLRRPVTLSPQLIQGDPSEGNILFAAGEAPAIIDIAPYWHPASYSTALLIADGIAWSGAPQDLLAMVGAWPEMDQLLLRAVLFRLYVGYLFRGGKPAAERRAAGYAPVIRAIERWR